MDAHARIVHGSAIIEDKLIENERLELTNKELHYFLGPGLTLRHCTVVLKVAARALIIRQARFIDCTFEVKQELTNHQDWVFASLEGCHFKGKLKGCDFGAWSEYTGDAPPGSIEGCDFSEAQLDGCRFMGCDERTLRFPRWPCFTFLDPIGRSPQLMAASWPERFGRVVIEDMRNHPHATRALTLFAPSEARRFDTSAEALQSAIAPFDFILS